MLPKTLPYTTYYKKDINVESLTKGTRAVISGVADQKALSQMQKDFAFNYAFNEETLLPLKCTVTGAVKDTVEEDYPVITVFDEETTDIEKGIAYSVWLISLDNLHRNIHQLDLERYTCLLSL